MTKRIVFVSYSRKDSSQVEKAVELLEAGGADIFRDIDDIQFGDRWEDVIRAKLAEAERVLVFWSQHAQVSEWVQREWSIALSMHKRVVPILLDQTPLPTELGQFHALSNFILPMSKPNQEQSPKSSSRWVVILGAAGLAVVLGFAGFYAKNASYSTQTPPLLEDSANSAVETGAGALVGNNQNSANSVQDSEDTPSSTANGSDPSAPVDNLIVPAPAKPAVNMPSSQTAEPVRERSQDYWVGLSIFMAFFAIIGYSVWKRRQHHKKQLQAGEQLVKAIFQE